VPSSPRLGDLVARLGHDIDRMTHGASGEDAAGARAAVADQIARRNEHDADLLLAQRQEEEEEEQQQQKGPRHAKRAPPLAERRLAEPAAAIAPTSAPPPAVRHAPAAAAPRGGGLAAKPPPERSPSTSKASGSRSKARSLRATAPPSPLPWRKWVPQPQQHGAALAQ
jgi:hypothetical protein